MAAAENVVGGGSLPPANAGIKSFENQEIGRTKCAAIFPVFKNRKESAAVREVSLNFSFDISLYF